MAVKINYKGSGSCVGYEFKCTTCDEIYTRKYTPSEKPDQIPCECGGSCRTHIDCAPAMDADYHQAGLFMNRDWEETGGYDG